jgi:hypothetical protein
MAFVKVGRAGSSSTLGRDDCVVAQHTYIHLHTYIYIYTYLPLLVSIIFVKVDRAGSSCTLEMDVRVAALLNDTNEALVLTYEARDADGPALASSTVYDISITYTYYLYKYILSVYIKYIFEYILCNYM